MRRLAAVALVALSGFACAETRRALGEECIKNDDCLSGVCVARACDDPPTSLERPLPPTPAPDAATTQGDAGADARGDAPADAGSGG